ncbi:MAG: type IV secretory system conjugative DNA transfer family protein [Clostridia bacterium]
MDGSGSGKTACYVKPNILQKLGSYVMTDPKGELFRETSGYLKDNGYKIMTLNLIDTEYSDRYNPLSHIKDHSDVDIIAQTIIMGNEKNGKSNDPFWDNTAKMLLKACIYYVISVLPEEEQNLSSCLNIVRAGGSDETLLDKLFIDELKPDHPGRKEYESIRLGADKTKQSIAISLVSKLSHFDTPNIQKVTTTNDFDFELLGREKVAIYVITPPDTDTYDYILTVFFSQLLQRLFSEASKRGGALKQPVYLLLDEFANIGQIPSFEKKLSVTRSYGISISIVVQSLDQLEALYKDNYENILGNCDTHLFLGSQSLKTCEYFCKSLGQKTIKYYSKSINKDKKEKEKQGVSLSEQRQGRELMTVDEIKRLDPEDEIILIRGLKPIKAKKYWYFKFHPQKDIVNQTIIHDISEMVKPEEIKICTMNVEEHFENRNKSIESNKKQVEHVENFKEVEDTKPIEEEYDLQKELEKKFDELFGENTNN